MKHVIRDLKAKYKLLRKANFGKVEAMALLLLGR